MITKQFIDHEDDNILKIYFENEGASANIHVLENDKLAFIFDLYSNVKNKGYGKKILKEIDKYCKKNKLALLIISEPYEIILPNETSEKYPIRTRENLKNWYINAGAVYLWDEDDTNNPVLVMGKHKF